MPELRKLVAGVSTFRDVKAETYNEFIKVTEAYRQSQLRTTSSEDKEPIPQTGWVLARNDSLVQMEVFQPYVITSVRLMAESGYDSLIDFAGGRKDGAIFGLGHTSSATLPEAYGKIAVPIEPIGVGEIGRVVISGVVPCWVRMLDSEHRFADFGLDASDQIDYWLRSGNSGAAEILWDFDDQPPGPDNAGNHCIIRLGNKTPEAIKRYRLRSDLSQIPDSGATAYEMEWDTDTEAWVDTDIEVEIEGGSGWPGFAPGSETVGSEILAIRSPDSGKIYPVAGDMHCEIGFYHGSGGNHYIRRVSGMDAPGNFWQVFLLDPDKVPVENHPIIAWQTHLGWYAAPYPFVDELVAACGITIDDETDEISVDVEALAGDGLEASGDECPKFQVKAACGITVDPDDGVGVDNAALAGDGLQAGADCKLEAKADCGISVSSDGIAVDNTALAGDGLVAGTGCTLDVDLTPGCGILASGATVSVDNTALAGVGLQAGSGCTLDLDLDRGCGIAGTGAEVRVELDDLTGDGLVVVPGVGEGCATLKVKESCHIDVTAAGVAVDVTSLADDGLEVVAGLTEEDCDTLGVKAGCNITVDSDGVSVDLDALPGPGLMKTTDTPCPKLKVKAGCHIIVDDTDGITVDPSTLIMADGGLDIHLAVEEELCDTIFVKAGCGILVGSTGVHVDRDALIQSDGGLEAGSGTCDIKVDLSNTSPLWSETYTCIPYVHDVSWNATTCEMTKTIKYLRIPDNVPVTVGDTPC